MADIRLTITLPDIGAQALAILMAGVGEEQCGNASHARLSHWKATDGYSPAVEINIVELMREAAEKVYAALGEADIDVLSRHGPR